MLENCKVEAAIFLISQAQTKLRGPARTKVATPGRLIDALHKGMIRLDEAPRSRMLAASFAPRKGRPAPPHKKVLWSFVRHV